MAARTVEIKKPGEIGEVEVQRPERVKLASEEALQRMREFAAKRKDQIITTVRKDKN